MPLGQCAPMDETWLEAEGGFAPPAAAARLDSSTVAAPVARPAGVVGVVGAVPAAASSRDRRGDSAEEGASEEGGNEGEGEGEDEEHEDEDEDEADEGDDAEASRAMDPVMVQQLADMRLRQLDREYRRAVAGVPDGMPGAGGPGSGPGFAGLGVVGSAGPVLAHAFHGKGVGGGAVVALADRSAGGEDTDSDSEWFAEGLKPYEVVAPAARAEAVDRPPSPLSADIRSAISAAMSKVSLPPPRAQGSLSATIDRLTAGTGAEVGTLLAPLPHTAPPGLAPSPGPVPPALAAREGGSAVSGVVEPTPGHGGSLRAGAGVPVAVPVPAPAAAGSCAGHSVPPGDAVAGAGHGKAVVWSASQATDVGAACEGVASATPSAFAADRAGATAAASTGAGGSGVGPTPGSHEGPTVCLVIGMAGSGKTTLMQVRAGRGALLRGRFRPPVAPSHHFLTPFLRAHPCCGLLSAHQRGNPHSWYPCIPHKPGPRGGAHALRGKHRHSRHRELQAGHEGLPAGTQRGNPHVSELVRHQLSPGTGSGLRLYAPELGLCELICVCACVCGGGGARVAGPSL